MKTKGAGSGTGKDPWKPEPLPVLPGLSQLSQIQVSSTPYQHCGRADVPARPACARTRPRPSRPHGPWASLTSLLPGALSLRGVLRARLLAAIHEKASTASCGSGAVRLGVPAVSALREVRPAFVVASLLVPHCPGAPPPPAHLGGLADQPGTACWDPLPSIPREASEIINWVVCRARRRRAPLLQGGSKRGSV